MHNQGPNLTVKRVLAVFFAVTLSLIFAGCQIIHDQPRLDTAQLVEIAERYQIPLPAKGCRLVFVHDGGGSFFLNEKRRPDHYLPAYLLEEDADGSALVLLGCERKRVTAPFSGNPVWYPFDTRERNDATDPQWQAYFGHPDSYICAIQTAAIGDTKTAQEIWRRFLNALDTLDTRQRNSIAGIEVSQIQNAQIPLLGVCLYNHLVRTLIQEPSSWGKASSEMDRFICEFPSLNIEACERLYRDLQITLASRPPQAGSVEDLLVKWSKFPTDVRKRKVMECRCHSIGAEDDPALQIVYRGYAAMPELIGLLEDRRITAHYYPGDGYEQEQIQRLGDLACYLALQMTGEKTTVFPRGDQIAALRGWWKKVQGQDEYTLLKRTAFRRVDETIIGINKCPSIILARKYPQKLNEVCQEYERERGTNAFDSEVADMLVASDLPRTEVVKKVKELAGRGSLGNRTGVLQTLAQIDEAACAKMLFPLLRSLPSDIQGGEYWTSDEARMSYVVVELDNEEVWREFQSAAKRCSVGLRMELMNPLSYTYIGDKNRSHRLAFLAAFLDDEDVREISKDKRFGGPCAGFTIDRLSVRDLAAIKIASILGIPGVPDGSWNNDQWVKYRQKVEAGLSKVVKR